MGERCFVVVFTKRSRTFDASRTTSKTREWFGLYKTNKAGGPELVLSEQAFQRVEELYGRAQSKRRAPVPHEQLLFDSRIQSTVAIHFELCRQLGWQKRLQTLPASVQHLSSGYTRKEHTAGLYTLAEGLYLMGDIVMLQPQVFSSGSPVLVAVRVSRRSCSTAYLLQQSTVIDLFPGLRDWPCARPHGDRARKEQHRCIASLLNTEKHDMHRVRLARVISTMEWPTKDLQVVLKLRKSQAV